MSGLKAPHRVWVRCAGVVGLLILPSMWAGYTDGDRKPALRVVVVDCEDEGQFCTPNVTVLLCNDGPGTAYVRRRLNRVWPGRWHALQARVIDAATGKVVIPRVTEKPVNRPLREGDFVALEEKHCYGAMIDLTEQFILSPGRLFTVEFVYSSSGPRKVGGVVPWVGTVRSGKYCVLVP